MGRETGPLQLLAPLLLTEGKGADLVIRGNVVLNRSNVWGSCCRGRHWASRALRFMWARDGAWAGNS
jgi:hypothetical protein